MRGNTYSSTRLRKHTNYFKSYNACCTMLSAKFCPEICRNYCCWAVRYFVLPTQSQDDSDVVYLQLQRTPARCIQYEASERERTTAIPALLWPWRLKFRACLSKRYDHTTQRSFLAFSTYSWLRKPQAEHTSALISARPLDPTNIRSRNCLIRLQWIHIGGATFLCRTQPNLCSSSN